MMTTEPFEYSWKCRPAHILVWACAVASSACDSQTSASAVNEVLGLETLGADCSTACGTADGKKCALPNETCASDLCLVDPDHRPITYCTVDCTNHPCPEGWDCEAIKAFGHEEVLRACSAQPANCGDDIVQLGEVCDGDSPSLGRCVDCQSWQAVCGDGVIQDGERCDGDTAEYYCLDQCSREQGPYIQFEGRGLGMTAADSVSGANISYMSAGFGGEGARFDLPTRGDSDGCGAVRVLEKTAELTLVAWTLCNEDGDRGNITMAFPRGDLELDSRLDEISPQWIGSADLRNADESVQVNWTMADFESLSIDTFTLSYDPPHLMRAWFQVVLEKDSLVADFTSSTAGMGLQKLEILHPPLTGE